MKKWTALTTFSEESRWRTLSLCLNEKGAANEFLLWPAELQKVEALSQLEGYAHIRLGSSKAAQVTGLLKVQSSWNTLLGVVDGMNHTPHGWWPLCALHETFSQLLVQLGQDLDTRGSVLIAGASGTARTALAAFFKAGFQNFLVTSTDENEAQEMIRIVRSRFFGMTVQWVPMEGIVMLPGESSVVVNCTPSVEENALLRELSYLNFLKRPGFLFDLSRGAKPSMLMQEAQDAGVRAISGVEIAARTDVLWGKWAFQTDLDLAGYQERLAGSYNAG